MGVLARSIIGDNSVSTIIVRNLETTEVVKLHDQNQAILAEAASDENGNVVLDLSELTLPIENATLRVYGEVAIYSENMGTGDGSTTVFTTDYAPIKPDTLKVYLNGVETADCVADLQIGQITFNIAPDTGILITADYRYIRPTAEAVNVTINGGDEWEFTYRLDVKIDGQLYTPGTVISLARMPSERVEKPLQIISPNLLPIYGVKAKVLKVGEDFGEEWAWVAADNNGLPGDLLKEYSIGELPPQGSWNGWFVLQRNPAYNPPVPGIMAKVILNVIGQSIKPIISFIYTANFASDVLNNTIVDNGILTLGVWEGEIPHVPMTSDTAPTPYVASASSVYNSNYLAWKAFNKTVANIYDCWVNAGTLPPAQWLKLDTGNNNGYFIMKYSITSRNESNGQNNPKDWELQGSNDNSTWITLDQRTNEPNFGNIETREYIVSGVSQKYRYFRLYITAKQNTSSYVAIGELRLFVRSDVYVTSGTCTSNIISINTTGKLVGSGISWTADTPTGTSVTVEVKVSTDNGATWTDWLTVTNNGSIPGLTRGIDVSLVKLQYRITLGTQYDDRTPSVSGLTINIDSTN